MNNLTATQAITQVDKLIIREKIPKGHGVKVVQWGEKWSVSTSPRKSTEEHNKMFFPLLQNALTEKQSPRATIVLKEIKERNEKALTPRLKRLINNTLSIRGSLETESEKIWLMLDYQSRDIIVIDPALYDYNCHQREFLIPLFEKNALLIYSTEEAFYKTRYYHANLIDFSYEGTSLGKYACASGPIYEKSYYYTWDTRGELWECLINLKPEVLINLEGSNNFLPKGTAAFYPLFQNRKKYDSAKVITKSCSKESYSLNAYFATKGSTICSKNECNILALQYSNWLEHESTPIKTLYEAVESVLSTRTYDSPVFVMSLNGVGRAGCFTIACCLYQLHKMNILNTNNRDKIIKDLVMQGRRIRGPSFVENVTQVELLLDYADFLIDIESE